MLRACLTSGVNPCARATPVKGSKIAWTYKIWQAGDIILQNQQ